MNEVLARKLLKDKPYCEAWIGSISIFVYEKILQTLEYRLTGKEREIDVLLECGSFGIGGFEVEPACEAFERYLIEGRSEFDDILTDYIPLYLDGSVEVRDFYNYDLASLFSEKDAEAVQAVLDDSDIKEEMCLERGFFAAIPHLDEMCYDCLLERACEGDESGMYAISSPKVGAYLEWIEEPGSVSRKYKKLYDEVFECCRIIRQGFDSNYCHEGVFNGVWYAINFYGFVDYSSPIGVYEMDPWFLPALYFFSKGVDKLNEAFGFYDKKEVRQNEAVKEAA